ncbi:MULTISPECIES: QueT transporter family protein [Acidaminococcus]|uniref:QueT transporter family protein n=1 Tax=Acidaminococcus TaxID=904 RepID=UPI002592F0E3|nr:QueT transporter family protein [Acidaminococcus sp.]MDO5597559.1 QueT transporter family protein [Acidaminococcus sp.]
MKGLHPGEVGLFQNALLAAIYAVLTLCLAPLSYGPIQVRISESLTLLAFYDKRWVPGLTVGCFLSNLGSPFGITDMVIGTLATFLGVFPMHWCPNVWVAALLPVISNGLLIGGELYYLAALPPDLSAGAAMAYIGLGELISVAVLGPGVMKVLRKRGIV